MKQKKIHYFFQHTSLILYLLVIMSCLLFLVIDSANDPQRLMLGLGIVVLILVGFVFSKHPGRVRWRYVYWLSLIHI